MHLADDHPLGAVDHEGTITRHQGHIAHVDVLFLDVADRLGACIFVDVPNQKTECHLQRCGISHAPLLALFNVVFWFFEIVTHELQTASLGEVLNRENRLEHLLKSGFNPLLFGCAQLHEAII